MAVTENLTCIKDRSGRHQLGVSLIGMLIGLFISMLCILASFTLYKSLISVATEGKLDNLYDGQLASALMISQMQIQNAGYGIEDADATDIVKIETPKAGTTDHKTELLWRYQDAGTVYCQGLREETVTITVDDIVYDYRELSQLEVSSGCNDTDAMSSFTYTKTNVLARWQKLGPLETYLNNNDKLFSFTIQTAQCAPFGAVAQDQHLRITISAPSSTTLNTSAGNATNDLTLCLANTYPS